MQQYFEGRERKTLKSLPMKTEGVGEKHENLIFANERLDSQWKSENVYINNSTFAKMGFKKSVFKSDNLSFNVFIDCYFRQTTFDTVNFTSCVFINCNFDKATFINCIFDYCRFEGCIIPFKALSATLPGRPNIRWDLCKNLSLESLKLGEENDYRKYFFEEKSASEIYYWEKFSHEKNDDYYKKYSTLEQISGLINFCLSKGNKLLWGYGEKLSRLTMNIVLVWIIFAIAYYFGVPTIAPDTPITFPIAMYMSLSNFFAVTCDYTPASTVYQMLTVIEGGVGIVLMGFFGAALFRYINRRG